MSTPKHNPAAGKRPAGDARRATGFGARLGRAVGSAGQGSSGRGSSGRAATKAEEGKPWLEVQLHPAGIRSGVRYLFLAKRQALIWSLGLLVYLAFLGVGLTLLPQVLSSVLAQRDYEQHSAQRALLGQRLGALVQSLEQLESETQDARLEMAKIHLAYGFDEPAENGAGGFPLSPRQAPESIFSAEIRRGESLQVGIREQMAVLRSFLQEVQAFESAHRELVSTTPSISPLRGQGFVLTSPYGSRRSPFTNNIEFHKGIDLAAPRGTPIHAPADGIVSFSGQYDPKRNVGWSHYGKLVTLRNGDSFVTFFGHCDELLVREGQRVRKGEIIATVGDTGWSTSPHLHYEVRRLTDGEFRPVDPRVYILDHRWSEEEQLLVRARAAPDQRNFDPLPSTFLR